MRQIFGDNEVMKKIFLISLLLVFSSVHYAQTRDFGQWENDMKAFEAADARQMPPKDAILFVGSSSIRMWTDLAADFPDKKIINRGFGGSQIADSTYFTDRIIIPYQPKMILLYAGDNDLNDGKTPEQVFADYGAFVDKVRVKLPKAKIAFIAIKPSPSRAELLPKMAAANEMIKKYSTRKLNLVFIDIYKPMLGADGQPRIADMLHMNRGGYDVWKKAIAPYLK
ncbi:MAG: hypothetical protein HOP17_04555 [Acidobacteria bacterium]|nr:hypothetical protein [Acidobacteriota bacterium]